MREDAWSPEQYRRFAAERSRPFRDLLALVRPRPGMRVVDLGCGTGELTAEAHGALLARETVGIDSSDAMLEKARPLAGGGLSFEKGEIGAFEGPGFDLILSNAALHWLPGHQELLPRLAAALAPGGQIAVQVPDNHDHPSHRIAREVGEEPPFRDALAGWRKPRNVLPPERYAEILSALGFGEQEVLLRVYGHLLAGPEEVVEWVRGTLLNDWKGRLAPDLFAAFVDRYRERLAAALPAGRPYFYTYRRILFWGQR
jgi:trans-aconitate 2-methyltransferase